MPAEGSARAAPSMGRTFTLSDGYHVVSITDSKEQLCGQRLSLIMGVGNPTLFYVLQVENHQHAVPVQTAS